MFRHDTIIVVPTKRPPPVLTLQNYAHGDYPVLIVADPDVYRYHLHYYKKFSHVKVTKGAHGLAPQIAACYTAAQDEGYDWWFRVDDDLAKRTFVHKEKGRYPSLVYALEKARRCIDRTRTTLAGFTNGSNRFWMGSGYARTYGLIHGGAQIVCSSADPSEFLDPQLPRYEDVFRTCAHRARDGAVGRVQFIGFDKSKSSNAKNSQSSITVDARRLALAKQIVLDAWPDHVTCNGTRRIHGGAVEIANWRMRRDRGYTP
jgi:hypothetical protein